MAKTATKTKPAKGKDTSDLINRDRYTYGRHEYKDAEGKTRKATDNGDRLSQAMRGKDFEGIKAVIDENGLTEKFAAHVAKGDKNAGHLRMLLGSSLRAAIKRGDKVTVDGKTIKTL